MKLLNISKEAFQLKVEAMPLIVMSMDIYQELLGYVLHYTTEVSGCGMIEATSKVIKGHYLNDPDITEIEYKINEVYLPERQTNTGGSTDIDEEMVHELMNSLISAGKDVEKMRLHWHSHANMATFHSSIDEDNYFTLNNRNFLISLVINRRCGFLGRVDYYAPLHISISNVPIFVEMTDGSKEVEERVKVNVGKLDKYIAKEEKNRWSNNRNADRIYGMEAGEHGYWQGGLFYPYHAENRTWDRDNQKWIYHDKTKKASKAVGFLPTKVEEFDSTKWIANARRARKAKEKIRKTLSITAEVARSFEDCVDIECGSCCNVAMCQRYLKAVKLIEEVIYHK